MITVVEVIDAIEAEVSDACVGPSKAFFELGGQRYTYRTYQYRAPTSDEALTGLKHVIIHAVRDAKTEHGIEAVDTPVMLFWRLSHKVELGEGAQYFARTRLVLAK